MATVADDGGDSAAFLGADDWTNDAEGKAFDVANTCVMVRKASVNFIITPIKRRLYQRHRHFFMLVSQSTNSYVKMHSNRLELETAIKS